MARFLSGEYLWQTGVTTLVGSLAFVRTGSYSLTPLGQAVFIFAVIGIALLVRSAVVPVRSEAATVPAEPGMLDAIVFAGLLYGLVKRSWFGIFPSLAESIGIPDGFGERLAAAIGISLMVGLAALAACTIAESLRTIGAHLTPRRFARTHPTHP